MFVKVEFVFVKREKKEICSFLNEISFLKVKREYLFVLKYSIAFYFSPCQMAPTNSWTLSNSFIFALRKAICSRVLCKEERHQVNSALMSDTKSIQTTWNYVRTSTLGRKANPLPRPVDKSKSSRLKVFHESELPTLLPQDLLSFFYPTVFSES